MVAASRFAPADLQESVRRELVDLLYTALPQVGTIGLMGVIGAATLTWLSGDPVYAAITVLIAVTAGLRIWGLLGYPRSRPLAPADVIWWERAYGAGATAFSIALGLLSWRALAIGDDPGAWITFGLSMSYCVGMVSRAAIRPWIVMVAAGALLAPTVAGGLMRPELAYKLGAVMLFFFWLTLREASRHLSRAFVERIEAKLALAHQANHDPLTGLPNRAAFMHALQGVSASGRRAFAVVAIDLDGFKPVNDRLGHQAGDALLRKVAHRLSQCVTAPALAARMGGDEFMLLLPFEGPQPDAGLAEALARDAVQAMARSFVLGEETVSIGASAGIALAAAQPGPRDLPSLLERVDAALYVAKDAGGGRWQWAAEPPGQQGSASAA